MTHSTQARASRRRPATSSRQAQGGVVMFVAIVVLIVMTLAGLAMLRQMSSGTSIAGNIAFKQGATAVADAGVEASRQWIAQNPGLILGDDAPNGYYATWGTNNVDPTSLAWKPMWNARPYVLVADVGKVKVITQRLCSMAGPSNGGAQQCSDFMPSGSGGGSKSGGSYSDPKFASLPAPFYRVTTRVEGPRNTFSYTQVVMQ